MSVCQRLGRSWRGRGESISRLVVATAQASKLTVFAHHNTVRNGALRFAPSRHCSVLSEGLGATAPKNPTAKVAARKDKDMRANIHRGRTNAKGQAFSANHNDRNFPLENSEHIDPSLTLKNVVWKFDASVDEYNLKSLDDYEQSFYEKYFSAALDKRNDKQIANRHRDRVQTIEQFRANPKFCPEEDIFNIGKNGDTVDPEIVKQAFEEYAQWHKTVFSNVIILDAALHVDEPNAAPHIQSRQVWIVERSNENGQTYLDISQKEALAAMGIERPDPTKKEGKYNNAKMIYTAITREKWLDIAESHGLDIDREPQDKSLSGLTLLQLKVRTAEEKLHKAEEDLDMTNSVHDLVKQQLAKDVAAINSAKDEADEVKKQTEEYVRSLEPAPTKTVKKFGGGEKEVPKTAEELQRDRDILAAQAVLRDKDKVAEELKELQKDREEFDKYVADRDAEYNQKTAVIHENYKRQLADQEDKHAKETAELRAENHTLTDKIKTLIEEKTRVLKSMAAAAAIKARTALDRKRRENGEVTPHGYDVDAQMRAAQQLYPNVEPPLSPKQTIKTNKQTIER